MLRPDCILAACLPAALITAINLLASHLIGDRRCGQTALKLLYSLALKPPLSDH
jgi:hypothetical protein